MSNEKVAQISQIVDAPTEPKTAGEWSQRVSDYDITLAGTLEPEIRSAIEALRTDAIQRQFLTQVTTPVKVEAPVQKFVQPPAPTELTPSVAENLKMWDAQIAACENSLKHSPPPHFIPAYRELLVDAQTKRAKTLHDFYNPALIPVPPPPPPIALPPEVVALITSQMKTLMPQVVAEVVIWIQKHKEYLQS